MKIVSLVQKLGASGVAAESGTSAEGGGKHEARIVQVNNRDVLAHTGAIYPTATQAKAAAEMMIAQALAGEEMRAPDPVDEDGGQKKGSTRKSSRS